MWTLTRVAWRNLWRHGRRTAITAVAMGIGVAMCMMTLALTEGMMGSMFKVLIDQQLGHVQVHHPDYPAKKALHDTIDDLDATLAELDGTQAKASTARLFGFGLVSVGEETQGGQVVGVVPEREARFGVVDDRIIEGRYLSEDPSGEALVGEGLADKLGVSLGSEMVVVTQAADGSLGNALFSVVGIYRSGDTMLDRSGAMVHLAELQDMLVLPDQVHQILLVAGHEDAIDALAAETKGALTKADDLLIQTWAQASPVTHDMVRGVDVQMGVMVFIVLGLASFGVLNTMLMAVFERTHELGVMMAVGMRPRQVVGMVIIESALLGILATIAGGIMGGVIVWYFAVYGLDLGMGDNLDMMGVTFDTVIKARVEPLAMVAVAVVVVVVSVLAALWPAWRAARLQPVEAIRAD